MPLSDNQFDDYLKDLLNTVPTPKYGPFTGGLRGGAATEVSNLLGLLSAAGLDTQTASDEWKKRAEEIIANTEGPKSYQDVTLSNAWDYLKNLAGQSAIPAAEMLAGGVTGALLKGPAFASRAATLARTPAAAEMVAGGLDSGAARAALAKAGESLATRQSATVGAVAGGLPQAAGDIEANIYEQTGQHNLPLSAAGAVPYSLLNLLGPEAGFLKAATGGRFLGQRAASGLTGAGWGNRAGRAGVGAVENALLEGVGETGQEGINQAARALVDPNASMASPEAMQNYLESFVGGAALGGAAGGLSGAFTKAQMQTPSDIAARVDRLRQDQSNIAQGLQTYDEQVKSQQQLEADVRKAEEAAADNAQKRRDSLYQIAQDAIEARKKDEADAIAKQVQDEADAIAKQEADINNRIEAQFNFAANFQTDLMKYEAELAKKEAARAKNIEQRGATETAIADIRDAEELDRLAPEADTIVAKVQSKFRKPLPPQTTKAVLKEAYALAKLEGNARIVKAVEWSQNPADTAKVLAGSAVLDIALNGAKNRAERRFIQNLMRPARQQEIAPPSPAVSPEEASGQQALESIKQTFTKDEQDAIAAEQARRDAFDKAQELVGNVTQASKDEAWAKHEAQQDELARWGLDQPTPPVPPVPPKNRAERRAQNAENLRQRYEKDQADKAANMEKEKARIAKEEAAAQKVRDDAFAAWEAQQAAPVDQATVERDYGRRNIAQAYQTLTPNPLTEAHRYTGEAAPFEPAAVGSAMGGAENVSPLNRFYNPVTGEYSATRKKGFVTTPIGAQMSLRFPFESRKATNEKPANARPVSPAAKSDEAALGTGTKEKRKPAAPRRSATNVVESKGGEADRVATPRPESGGETKPAKTEPRKADRGAKGVPSAERPAEPAAAGATDQPVTSPAGGGGAEVAPTKGQEVKKAPAKKKEGIGTVDVVLTRIESLRRQVNDLVKQSSDELMPYVGRGLSEEEFAPIAARADAMMERITALEAEIKVLQAQREQGPAPAPEPRVEAEEPVLTPAQEKYAGTKGMEKAIAESIGAKDRKILSDLTGEPWSEIKGQIPALYERWRSGRRSLPFALRFLDSAFVEMFRKINPDKAVPSRSPLTIEAAPQNDGYSQWLMDALTNEPTVPKLLAAIEANSAQPIFRLLAKDLAKMDLSKITVSVSDTVGYRNLKRIGGTYDPETDAIVIYRDGMNSHSVMHEIVHAVTAHHLIDAQELILKHGKFYKGYTPEQRRIIDAHNQLSILRNKVRDALDLQNVDYENRPELYALRTGVDIKEFVAEALSNEYLQNLLQQIPAEAKAPDNMFASVWTKFKSAISWLLGMNRDNLLGRVLELTADVTDIKSDTENVLGAALRRATMAIEASVQDNANAQIFAVPMPTGDIVTTGHKLAGQWSHGMDAMVRRDTKEKALDMLSAAKNWYQKTVRPNIHTVRYIAGKSYGWTSMWNMAKRYQDIKLFYQNHFNERLGKLAMMKGESKTRVADMLLATTLLKHAQLSTTEGQRAIAKYLKADDNFELPALWVVEGLETTEGTEDTTGARYIVNPKFLDESAPLIERGLYTKAEMDELVGPNGEKVLSSPSTEAEYAAYKDAMRAMMDGAAVLYRAQERAKAARAIEVMDAVGHDISETARSAIDKLRSSMMDYITRGAEKIDPTSRRIIAVSDEKAKLLKNLEKNMPGVFTTAYEGDRSLDVANATDEQFKEVADATGLAVDEVKRLTDTIRRELEGKNTTERAKAVTKAILSSVEENYLDLSARVDALQSIMGGYIPLRRRGRFLLRALWVGEDGKELRVAPSFAKLLPVWAHDSESMLGKLRDEANKEYAKLGLIDVPVLVDKKDNPAGWELRKARVVMDVPPTGGQREMELASHTSDRLNYLAIMQTLDRIGIKLTLDQRDNLIRMATTVDSAIRSKMYREGRPGADMDFMTSISEDLSRRASLIGMREVAPQIEGIMADPYGIYWGDGRTTKRGNDGEVTLAEQRLEAAKATKNAAAIKHAESELAYIKSMFELQQADNVGTTRKMAHDWANWWLTQGAAADDDYARTLRTMTTVMQLGLNVAAAVTNLSSLPLHTFSALSTHDAKTGFGGGFGPVASSAAIIKAFRVLKDVMWQTAKQINPFDETIFFPQEWLRKQIAKKPDANGLIDGYTVQAWRFMLQESESGVTQAQRYNAMMASANKKLYGKTGDKVMGKAMALFAATEEMNRMTTLLASYELFSKEAEAAGLSKEKQGDKASPFERYVHNRAIRMVYDTQGDYTQANRPKLFREGVMSMAFMYKTFAITSVELIQRMPPSGKLLFLGMLQLSSGAQGLPLFEELMTVLDVISQRTGLGMSITKGNIEREADMFLKALGKEWGIPLDRYTMRGILDTTIGTDVFSRTGINVGIPLIGAGRAGADFEKELGKALGAPVGFVGGVLRTAGALTRGELDKALKEMPITGIRNAGDAYLYAKYDNVLNRRGQIVQKGASPVDIAARVLGYYPTEFTRANDFVRLEEYTRAFAKELTNEFVEEHRRYQVLGDRAGMAEVRGAVRDHNQVFRGTSLEILDFGKKAERAGKAGLLTLVERELKSLPRAQKKEAAFLGQ
jgi:hypothetical protein